MLGGGGSRFGEGGEMGGRGSSIGIELDIKKEKY